MSPPRDQAAKAKAIAERLSRSLASQGAHAVALVGSYARNAEAAASDIDLAVVGDGPRYRLEVHDDLLVSIGWAPTEEQRRRLYDPAWLGSHVPGWQTAAPIHDPEGLAASLRQEARDWSWGLVEDRCDAWVAESVTGYAEEVEKMAASITRGETSTAAVQRSVLVLRLPQVMALHRRILYGSENQLWDVVARNVGPAWAEAQSVALGFGGVSLETGCSAAFRLFTLAADEVMPLLDERQRAVIEKALRDAEILKGL